MEKTSNFSVAICGFMGAGKTTLANQLKESSTCNHEVFRDLDDEILKEFEEKSIQEITSIHGWEKFREVELGVAKDLLSSGKIILSLGGGALSDELINFIFEKKIILLWAYAPFENCFQRIQLYSQHRPLAKKSKEELYLLYQERVKNYEKAHFTFDNSNSGTNLEELERLNLFLKNLEAE